jgi:hypothetical protein
MMLILIYGNKTRYFQKVFLENQNWTFIFVHFSNYKKTFVDFITLFVKLEIATFILAFY